MTQEPHVKMTSKLLHYIQQHTYFLTVKEMVIYERFM